MSSHVVCFFHYSLRHHRKFEFLPESGPVSSQISQAGEVIKHDQSPVEFQMSPDAPRRRGSHQQVFPEWSTSELGL